MAEDEDFTSQDYVAARVESYTSLLVTIEGVKDRKLREEAMLMLRAVRMSFKTEPQGQVVAIKDRVGQPR